MGDYSKLADELENEMKQQKEAENEAVGYEYEDDEEFIEEPQNEPINSNAGVISVPNTPKEVVNFTDIATSRMQEDFISGKRDVNETGKEIIHALTLEKAVDDNNENQDFLKDIKKAKQEELKLNFENKVLDEEKKKLEAKQKKAEAFYKAFRPILEFDFSNLRKINKKRVIKADEKVEPVSGYRKKPQAEYIYEREAPKTYDDRSYGIPLMVLMLIILTLPYCLVTIVLSIFNAINEIFMQVANFGKPALVICSTLAILTVIGVGVYLLLLIIQSSFGVTIFPEKTAEMISLLL